LASYAAAGISGANAMATSVASFRIGIAAFIVPFMFFYNSALLMEAEWFEIARAEHGFEQHAVREVRDGFAA